MYLQHFGLREMPFSLAPDPRYLYLSRQHREALAHLLYGVRQEGGFVLLTGEVGMGKTTVCRCFLEQLPAGTRTAVIFNPKLSAEELLASVCEEFAAPLAPGQAGVKAAMGRLNEYLLALNAEGGRAVLVIDEAQNLSAEVMEHLRLLTNLETSRHKLLQIILLGQPELREALARPELRQLAQRITARFHLGPLSHEETAAYVRHRLEVAGTREELFPREVTRALRRLSGGIPRRINIICDRALLGAFTQASERVDRATLERAAREVAGGRLPWDARLRGGRTTAVAGIAAALLAVALATAYLRPTGGTGEAPRGGQAPPSPGVSSPGTPSSEAAPAPEGSPPAGLQAAATAEAPEPAPGGKASPPSGGTTELDALLADSAALTEEAASSRLFALWGVSYRPGGGPACDQARAQGLECYRGRGGLELLRRLNRAAVLTLYDEGGGARHVLLAGLDGPRATLVAGDRIASAELKWLGEFTLLWRPPHGRAMLAEGDEGPAVAWLAGRLAREQGGEGAVTRFDAALLERVRGFQRASGLVPDGIAGPQTLLFLDRDPGPGTPVLRAGT